MLSATRFAASLFLLPAWVYAHDCPAFVLDTPIARDMLLNITTDFVPQSIKDIVTASPDTMFTGNYDCHAVSGEYEVGVAFICDGDECSCTALYQFDECKSCTVCGAIGDINSFSADCSNVRGGFSRECTVECGYMTSGCFDPDAVVMEPANETAVEVDTPPAETPETNTTETATPPAEMPEPEANMTMPEVPETNSTTDTPVAETPAPESAASPAFQFVAIAATLVVASIA